MSDRALNWKRDFRLAVDSIAEKYTDQSTGESARYIDTLGASVLLEAVETVASLKRYKGILYSHKQYRRAHLAWGLVTSHLGHKLLGCADGYLDNLEKTLQGRKIHPSVSLLLSKIAEHGMTGITQDLQCQDERSILIVVEKANAFADDLRSAARSKEFKIALDAFRRSSSNNFRSVVDFYSKIIGSHSRVLSVRIDLSYRDGSMCGVPNLNGELLILSHRDAFIRHLKAEFKLGLLGYLWKIEYGRRKGFHIHFHALFNGSLHQQDVLIGKMLGDYWVSEITGGLGIYRNCNANKSAYHFLALGNISRADDLALKGLGKIALYFSKSDLLVRFALTDGRRSLGKSVLRSREGKRGPKPVSISLEKFTNCS
jgi:hypothetical protein